MINHQPWIRIRKETRNVVNNEEQEAVVEENVAATTLVENSPMGYTSAGDPIAANSYANKSLEQALILNAASSVTALANMAPNNDSEARIVDLARQLNEAIADSYNAP